MRCGSSVFSQSQTGHIHFIMYYTRAADYLFIETVSLFRLISTLELKNVSLGPVLQFCQLQTILSPGAV